jgi:diguanylate cyclase (GGDEF)-like protein/PAS domain S-box-containing protein
MNDRSGSPAEKEAPASAQGVAGYAGLPRDAQLEYKAILANASIGIAFTRERKFFLCNPRFAEMLGWNPDELIGQAGTVVYPSKESYEQLGAIAIPLLGTGRKLDVEWEVMRKDGSVFPARIIAKAISAADVNRGTVWIVEDITEDKRREDEVARLLREQEAILQGASIGICFVRERRIVRCNRRFEEQHGFQPGEMIGMPTSATYASEQDYKSVGDAYARLAAERSYSAVSLSRRKDGSTYWSRVTGSAMDPADPERGAVWLDQDITDQKRAEEELQRVLRDQELILDNATVGILFVRNRVIQRVNRRLLEMTGYEAAELVGKSSATQFADPGDWEKAVASAYATPPGGTHDAEWRIKRKDGSVFLCRTRGRRIDAGDAEQQWIWSYEDVTAERLAEERVRRALAEQELILENATVGISFARDRLLQRCNRRLEEMFGYDQGELVGRNGEPLFASPQEYERVAGEIYQQLPKGLPYVAEHRLKRKDGSFLWCKLVVKAIDPARIEEGTIAIFDDVSAEHAAREQLERAVGDRTQELVSANRRLEAEISDRKQAETRAQHLADHDPLTGLPNRRLLEDRLTQAIARGDRNQKPTAVMFVDLDRFKVVNDTLGHAVGDLLLKECADRLVKQLRVGDTVCRLGGDEFVVVLPEISRASDAAGVAQKIIDAVALPFVFESHELQVSVSVGISVFPDDGGDAETLIRNSDAAMYHAKETGRACYQFFTEQMNVAASKRVAIEGDLRRAVQDNALRVHYQPIVNAAGETVAREALVRWQHPVRGTVPPAEFLQLAEDTGLILRIGEWVLRETCRWINFVGAEQALPVSVNLSARQFADPRLADMIGGVLKDAGVPARLLQLEVSEATAMLHADMAQATLNKLKALGVSLSLDNFGSAFSNAANLRRFPLDRLKIDRSLIAETRSDKDSEAIVAAMTGLAHALGLQVVAEGVETEAQRDFLRSCGCDYMQGFLFGRPAEADTEAKPQP